jgi:5,5'-dehydrodivanillate O-demethylase
LNEARNRLLTRIGPGTPMGNLLRRYWHPIAAADEMEREAVKPLRILGEDLVLYRDLGGIYGMVDRRCAHRGADLANGYVERCGLRCSYHGWVYREDGRCMQRPFEEVALPQSRSKESVAIKAYPVQAKGGLIWAYLGPQPAPLLPDWEPFGWENGFVQIVFADVPCNWLQCQENSVDPVHFEWAHANWSLRQEGQTGPYSPTHIRLDFEEFEYGLVYKRVREDTDEQHPLWTVGRVCLYPNGFFLGDHFEWRVPVDDENTLSVTWAFNRVPKESEPYVQESIPSWRGPIRHPDGRWITSHVMNQDFVMWLGQGRIADRTQERLGASDRGVILLRRRLLADVEAVARGEDPKGLIRDPAANRRVALPVAMRRWLVDGVPRKELLAHPVYGRHAKEYIFQYGQPERVRSQYLAAMGLDEDARQRAAAR